VLVEKADDFCRYDRAENLLIGGYHNPDRDAARLVLDRSEKNCASGSTSSAVRLRRRTTDARARPRADGTPGCWLLDEPSAGLAPSSSAEVFNEIRQMKDLAGTVLLVEQNVAGTLQIADRAYVMETGEIIWKGQAADLLHNPEVKRAYLGKAEEVWYEYF